MVREATPPQHIVSVIAMCLRVLDERLSHAQDPLVNPMGNRRASPADSTRAASDTG